MIWSERGGGADGPLVVLLHGLGHTAEVWRELVGQLPGGWLVLDLPGHGRSPWRDGYGYDGVAAAVAEVLPADRPIVAVGHSMGGVVALALAARRPEVRGVLGFGIKVAWTADELAALHARAAKPPKVYATEEQVRAAFVRFGGLDGLVSPDSELAGSGVTAADGGYRLAADPRTMAVDAPDMPALLTAARGNARVVLARGEHDQLVSAEQLRAVDPDAVDLPGVGHNVHVTHPERLRELIEAI